MRIFKVFPGAEDVYERAEINDPDPANERNQSVSDGNPLENSSVDGLEDSVHDDETDISGEQSMLTLLDVHQMQPQCNCTCKYTFTLDFM